MSVLEIIHRAIEILPVLAKFAVFMVLVISMPRLSRCVRLPDAVGLLLSGVLLGPHVLDVFSRKHLVAEFFSELGMLLLMFFAGLEINLTLFREKIFRSIVFGVVTTSVPLVIRKNSITHGPARESIRDASRQGSDWHGPRTILHGDGANLDVGGRER